MPQDMDRISSAMGIQEDLKKFVTIVCLRSVRGGMICGLGTYGCVEGESICLTYVGKYITDVHLPHRQGLEESVFNGGIGEFGNHEDDTRNNLD